METYQFFCGEKSEIAAHADENGNVVSLLTEAEKEAIYQQYISLLRPGDIICIQDVLSEYVTFVSATNGGTCTGSDISWSITVPADTRISVSYTVKVKDGVATYAKIDGAKATINGVAHKCLDTYVANTLTAEQQQQIVEAVNTVKGMDVTGLTSV